MNIHSREVDASLDQAQAQAALKVLLEFARTASDDEISALGPIAARLIGQDRLNSVYPTDFVVDAAYKSSLPDLQNGPASLIKGANEPIQHVGISNFRLPLRYPVRGGGETMLETSVTGTVSLEADKKGINMSRIMRSFYKHSANLFGMDVIDAALADYQTDLDSFDARIALSYSYPMLVQSLRSGLSGYQYYDVTLEYVARAGTVLRIMHLDYVYSSTCPCSLELSEHARRTRGQLATPHAQRSVARLSVAMNAGAGVLTVEDVVDMCRRAVPTETQVMVKREDEQAFAELNAANPIFVEDAARLFFEQLQSDARIGDFRVVASHQESLHSHDAVSVLARGTTFDTTSLEPKLFETLIHR